MERQKRKEEIQKGLSFIQSPLPYPGNQREYEMFLRDLVRNLFLEGNDLYRDGQPKLALVEYMEALNVAQYAASDDVEISQDLLGSLYVNRAACFFCMALYLKALVDCDQALQLNEGNVRALFRKARALMELGRHKEAYECSAKCLLSVPHDDNVIQLAQDLAQKLGLRVRKAYIRAQHDLEAVGIVSNGDLSCLSGKVPINGLGSINDIETDCPVDIQCVPAPVATSIPVSDASVTPDPSHKTLPSQLPLAPSRGLGCSDKVSLSVPESVYEFTDGEIIGEDLDTLLDSLPDEPMISVPVVQGPIPTNLPTDVPQLIPVKAFCSAAEVPSMTPLPPILFAPPEAGNKNVLGTFDHSRSLSRGAASSLAVFGPPRSAAFKLDTLDRFEASNSLDSLDVFSGQKPKRGSSPIANQNTAMSKSNTNHGAGNKANYRMNCSLSVRSESLPSLPGTGTSGAALLTKNPLVLTHEFRQACHQCFPKTGPKALDYTYRPDVAHKCKKNILLARIRNGENPSWKRIRPRPNRGTFIGSFCLCKDIASRQDCKYGDNCTFAYCQEEIDVWTQERKGALNRDLLFDPLGGLDRGSLSVVKLLQTHQGIFMFLCQECFDSKPRIISKRNKESPPACTNQLVNHDFEKNKCLVHIVRSTIVKYSKVRQLHNHYQFDICRHEVRYGCLREDACNFAHSLMELKVWVLQFDSGISHNEIVQESKKYWQNVEANTNKVINTPASSTGNTGSLDLKMKFACGQCWRNRQVVEPDKNLKYCSAKAHHSWTKERCVLLVMSKERKRWVSVRPLPMSKNFPQQYDLCIHVQKGRKCQYVGNCSFAHSLEERDMWTYMKNNNLRDMQQTYEMWLKYSQARAGEGTLLTSRDSDRQILMPTDYADLLMGFHCWLCGKNSNSEKQWQQHIQSEKHKERVFSTEDDPTCWLHRFPMGEFQLCQAHEKTKACPEGSKCPFAHGQEELNEWLERKELLRSKVAKARKDMLLAQSDTDFGKYNFIFEDQS
ncbi:zinc finger CCCH domain-containing protein 7B [Latimeria chalumnae]|uniref:zinc finger CCCH domain-containing protein 7B n=1 Tax=Latimeria chalumnae TaxID=7897 RepID=UPI00313D27EA